VQVTAIAMIVAIGSGMFAALGSLGVWRGDSYDASYSMLRAHDLRVSLPQGSTVPEGTLTEATSALETAGVLVDAEERLVLPTQVDASSGERTILVPGVAIGMDLREGGPHLDRIHVTGGRALRAEDAVPPGAAILEAHFADHYGLPPAGRIRLAGDRLVRYVGTGYAPEYFIVTTEAGGFLAESNFAAVFAPLPIVQEFAGGRVTNDLVVEVAPGADRADAARRVTEAVRAAAPDIAITVTPIEEDAAYRALYGDKDNDQRTMGAVAILILAAAVFAAFNLTSRIVEARRREIGVGMALGQSPWSIAARPLLTGLETGLLGVVLGVGVGLLIDAGFRSILGSMQPMPVWHTAFQPTEFAKAAALGLTLPVLAALWPVWRAVRVHPVDAIRTGHLAVKGGRAAPLLKRVTMGGRAMRLMPIRNVVRSPRRTILTAIGIGASITAMVGVIGMVDSLNATIDRGAAEIARGAPGRLEIDLVESRPIEGSTFRGIERVHGVRAAQPALRVPGRLGEGTAAFDVVIEVLDPAGSVWHPTLEGTVRSGGLPGIVLARKAAGDLGVEPGDIVVVTHPVVEPGSDTFRLGRTEMRVIGSHPSPMRSVAYVHAPDAALFGLAGQMNAVHVAPDPGADIDDLTRSLFRRPGVASVRRADATIEVLRDLMVRFLDILRFVEIFVLLLALLIAFNAASIAVDERAREHATMSAFGVPTRRILACITIESMMVGLVGTGVGVGLGALVVRWLMSGTGQAMPDIELIVAVSVSTIATAFALGVVAVGLAPLLTVRRLLRMDVPSTLRVME
jgi:putative ABC transport system permease protein